MKTAYNLDELIESHGELKRLKRVASALASSITSKQVAIVIAEECKRALQSDAVCAYLNAGDTFEMIAEIGCSVEFKQKWKSLPVQVLARASESLGPEHDDLCLGSADAFIKILPGASELIEKAGRETIAYVPMKVEDETIGLLAFSFKPAPKPLVDCAFIFTLANLCAQALDRIRLFQREAAAASRAKSEFLANMSHEIRTPLGLIQGFVELLSESPGLSPLQAQWADLILRNAQHLSRIIGDVIDISKLEGEKLEIEFIPVVLNELIETVKSITSSGARQKGLHLSFHCDVAGWTILSDPVRLRQMMVNLVNNAIKFTEKGWVRVDISRSRLRELQIMVTDSGIGVPPGKKDHVFEPFVQADSSMGRRFGGTGLGLAITKGLAHSMGGDLELVSGEKGVGSVFRLHLACEFMASAPQSPRSSTGEAENLSGLEVLLVEDSIDNQMLVRHMLNQKGIHVDVAGGGRDGIAMALSHDYNLVLMDIQMPEVDGYEAVSVLRARGFNKPIAALSAGVLKSDVDGYSACGFDAFLTKPIDRALLISTVKSLSQRLH